MGWGNYPGRYSGEYLGFGYHFRSCSLLFFCFLPFSGRSIGSVGTAGTQYFGKGRELKERKERNGKGKRIATYYVLYPWSLWLFVVVFRNLHFTSTLDGPILFFFAFFLVSGDWAVLCSHSLCSLFLFLSLSLSPPLSQCPFSLRCCDDQMRTMFWGCATAFSPQVGFGSN